MATAKGDNEELPKSKRDELIDFINNLNKVLAHPIVNKLSTLVFETIKEVQNEEEGKRTAPELKEIEKMLTGYKDANNRLGKVAGELHLKSIVRKIKELYK